ncbi:class III poly(R)-hydroxyalkanoic acid synthase subunit PhaE [Magnetococcus sp. PR-3]|uniref:class III poly(R)-hydroxyalkanoic acid synthase subunit PhaE n=1 Tax=Magnetococcus sp. PR-3 TaxID=3120355 RepID=UPI002FCE24CD
MSDNAQAFNSWMSGWNEMQKQSWDTWSKTAWDMMAQGAPQQGAPNPMSFWQESMKPWMSMGGGESMSQMPWVTSALGGQSDAFMKFSEQIMKAFSTNSTGDALSDWNKQVDEAINNLKKMFDPKSLMGEHESLTAFWGMPMDTFRRVFSSMGATPGDWLTGLKGDEVNSHQEAVRTQMEKFLSVPALGYTRESQEQHQEGVLYWLDFQQALHNYLSLMSTVGTKSLDELRNIMMDEPEKLNVDSLKGLYDLWVHCAEEAYGDITASDEHAVVNANLINTMMKLKHHQQQLSGEMFKAMNLPDRQEMERAHKGVQQLKRKSYDLADQIADLQKENSRLKEQVSAVDELRAEFAALRNELDSLNGGTTAKAAPAKKPAARTTAAKTTAAKTAAKKPATKRASNQQGES